MKTVWLDGIVGALTLGLAVMSDIRVDIDTSFSLPREYYFSEGIFAQELTKVFGRQWLLVGHVSSVRNPGDYVVKQVGMESLIITRGGDGTIHAFFNVCRHRGFQICAADSAGNARRFTCPYHAWTYDNLGNLLAAPGVKNGTDIEFSAYGLHEAWCRTYAGFIFVCLSKQAPPEFTVPAQRPSASIDLVGPERMKLAHRETYVIGANWKSVIENDCECYHCGTSHPSLAATCEYRAFFEDSGLGNGQQFPLRAGMKTLSMDGDWVCKRRFAQELPEGFSAGFLFVPFFCGPLFFADHCISFETAPLSVDKTRMTVEWFVHEDAVEGVDYDGEQVSKLFHLTNLEDKALMERNYAGVKSMRYVPGPNVGPREGLVREAYRRYQELMNA